MPSELTSLLRIEVPLIVHIGSRKMLMRDVLALAPGAIIELPKDAADELDVLVNNKPIGRGRAVKVGENFGIRLTAVGTASETLHAMSQRLPMPADSSPSSSASDDDHALAAEAQASANEQATDETGDHHAAAAAAGQSADP